MPTNNARDLGSELIEDHDRGLAFDLRSLLHRPSSIDRPSFDRPSFDRPSFDRRRALKLFGGAALVAVAAACGSDDSSNAGDSSSSTSGSSSTSTSSDLRSSSATTSTSGTPTSAIPEETAGPFPGDGSNGPNALAESGVVRSDIRSSFGSASGTAEGIPATVNLRVLDAGTGGALPGAAVYLWHCDRDGLYSMYSDGVTDQNYLRGVQAAGDDGTLTFTTIFPAAYSGRWPHMHFEVYSSVDDATASGSLLATSQLALPEDVCDEAYATSGYEQSVRNMSSLSIDTDGIFRDGYSQQLATVSGSATAGYTLTLDVPV